MKVRIVAKENATTEAEQLKTLQRLVREMHEADDAYGCGFYGEDNWLKAYRASRVAIGMPEREL